MQVGAFSEYFVKMEFTMYGFEVYGTEVDDRGIDFIARYKKSGFLAVQVKSVRDAKYVFVQKDKFPLANDYYLALAILNQSEEPTLYLIPATVWETPNSMFVSRDYEGKKSKPEWGINLSKKNLHFLKPYEIEKMLQQLQST